MCLAQYFCELALTICPREQKADSFLSLVLNSLYLLSENKRSADLIKPCLEMRLASMAGYARPENVQRMRRIHYSAYVLSATHRRS